MSVLTKTTNETNTDETASTLSFPNSSETEYTYNTNPSIITSEDSSNSTLVFPSEDSSNSTLVFPSEDSSNSTLVFPSEDVSNSTLVFDNNKTRGDNVFPYTFMAEGFFINKDDLDTTKLSKMNGFCLEEPTCDNCSLTKDSTLYNYYIESKQNNNKWWTSYENHFTGKAIAVIERKEGTSKIDEICFINRSHIESSLQLNKYDILVNNILIDKNCRYTLKEKLKKVIKIRDQQIRKLFYNKKKWKYYITKDNNKIKVWRTIE
jgi:hypothetical protein